MSMIEKAMARRQKKNEAESAHDIKNTVSASAADPVAVRIPGSDGEKIICKLANSEILERQGLLIPEADRNLLAEEYRLIKRPLLMNAFGKVSAGIERGNLVMISSALPGEGKTFTSFNLAMSMALELNSTVLLVDSDVIKPSLTRLLGLENQPGLTDVLLNSKMDLSDVIFPTDLPRLKVMPAGCNHVHSTELLASDQMGRLAQDLSERYPDRIVVFDAPPLLVTSEASVLAHQAGQILLVVEAAKTPQRVVKEAISRLNADKVIGMVLNKSRRSFRGGYGGYYGAYGK